MGGGRTSRDRTSIAWSARRPPLTTPTPRTAHDHRHHRDWPRPRSSARGTSACRCRRVRWRWASTWSASTSTPAAWPRSPAASRSSTTWATTSWPRCSRRDGSTRPPTAPTWPASTSPSSRCRRRCATARPTCATSRTPPRSSRRYVRAGSCVILESTTYPGTTEEVFVPLLEGGSGLRAGADFAVGYSPERIDPSNDDAGTSATRRRSCPASTTPRSTRSTGSTPRWSTPPCRVAGVREAELAKLLENTFRHVNIALVNELAMFSHELGIDVWDGDRRGRDQAVRVHAVHPRPGRRRPLPADRPLVPLVAGSPGRRADVPLRRARQRRQRAHARLRRHPRRPQLNTERKAVNGSEGARARARLQEELRRRPRVAGRGRGEAPRRRRCRGLARSTR